MCIRGHPDPFLLLKALAECPSRDRPPPPLLVPSPCHCPREPRFTMSRLQGAGRESITSPHEKPGCPIARPRPRTRNTAEDLCEQKTSIRRIDNGDRALVGRASAFPSTSEFLSLGRLKG